MEIFERLNCVIIDGKSYVKASDAKLMYDEIERLREALKKIADLSERFPDWIVIKKLNEFACNALKEKE
jgi:hypothetical protein